MKTTAIHKNTRRKPRLSVEAILAFAHAVEALDRIPRAGYVMRGVMHPQTVAAHTHGVALWCLLLIERMPAQPRVDVARILRMAALHEIGEARLMDIPHPARIAIGAQIVSDAERRVVRKLLADLPAEWLKDWEEFEDARTLEARVVKAADKLELMHRVLMYERQHNGNLDEFWIWDKNFRWEGIPAARELFAAMQRRHRAGR